MANRKLLLAAVFVALVGGVAYLNTPPALVNAAMTPQLPDDIESWLGAWKALPATCSRCRESCRATSSSSRRSRKTGSTRCRPTWRGFSRTAASPTRRCWSTATGRLRCLAHSARSLAETAWNRPFRPLRSRLLLDLPGPFRGPARRSPRRCWRRWRTGGPRTRGVRGRCHVTGMQGA